MNNSANIVNAKPVATGAVLYAPVGTDFPETAVAPATGFAAGGYVTEDGVTKSESRDINSIKDMGGLTVKRTQTGYEVTFQFAFLEYLSVVAAQSIYGADAVAVTAATAEHGTRMKITAKGQEAPHKAWVFDMADGLAHLKICVPDGQVGEVGDTTYGATDAATRDVTITCFPDAEGALYYELTDDGVKAITVADLPGA
jgi:hypothetical protein